MLTSFVVIKVLNLKWYSGKYRVAAVSSFDEIVDSVVTVYNHAKSRIASNMEIEVEFKNDRTQIYILWLIFLSFFLTNKK